MKSFVYTILLFVVFVTNAALHADPTAVELEKDQLNVNFNRMIDDGNHAKREMKEELSEHMETSQSSTEAEKTKVLDFIDVEVGWGDTPNSVVDRRFDSVTGPQVLDLNALVPNFLIWTSKIP